LHIPLKGYRVNTIEKNGIAGSQPVKRIMRNARPAEKVNTKKFSPT
jgi:hypothetical protein